MMQEIYKIRAEKIMNRVRCALESMDFTYSEKNGKIIFQTQGDDTPFAVMIDTSEERELLRFFTFFDKIPDQSYYADTAILISKLNAIVPVGAFTLNETRGAIGFQITSSYCQSLYDELAVIEMIYYFCCAVDSANDLFAGYFEGSRSIDAFLEEFEQRMDECTSERNECEDEKAEAIQAEQNFKIVCDALDSIHYRYSKDSKNLTAYFFVTGDDMPIEMTFKINSKQKVIDLACGLEFKFPQIKTDVIAQACCYATNRCTNGSFYIKDDTVGFKLQTAYSYCLHHIDQVLYMLNAASDLCDHFNDSFKMLSDGDMMLDEFLEL